MRLSTCFVSLDDLAYSLDDVDDSALGAPLFTTGGMVPPPGEDWLSVERKMALFLGAEGWLELVRLAGLAMGFAPLVALQLVGVLCGTPPEIAFCDGCHQPYIPSRRPRAGRRHFCESCRHSPLPAGLRKRDQLARQRRRKEASYGE